MTPDVVEYDKSKMTKTVYDLILGCKTMKEITIDKIILPMRHINSLTRTKMERAWTVNNSMAHKPHCTHEATK